MTFAILRGGRVRAICWPKPTYRRVASRNSIVRFGDCCAVYASSHKIHISKPSLLTMVPTLVATTICAGWVPQKGDLANLARQDPSRSSVALYDGRITIHPEYVCSTRC